jgi:hypothetical protein
MYWESVTAWWLMPKIVPFSCFLRKPSSITVLPWLMDFTVHQLWRAGIDGDGQPCACRLLVPAHCNCVISTMFRKGVSLMKIARSFAIVTIKFFAIPALMIALLSSPFIFDVQSALAAAGRRRNSTTKYITGPRGGCYYINSNGKKTYVDRSRCGSSSNGRVTSSGYIRGPRGGCYYINGNGNKTYVNRSLCN